MSRSLEVRRRQILRQLVRITRAIAAEQKQLARIEARLAALNPEKRKVA